MIMIQWSLHILIYFSFPNNFLLATLNKVNLIPSEEKPSVTNDNQVLNPENSWLAAFCFILESVFVFTWMEIWTSLIYWCKYVQHSVVRAFEYGILNFGKIHVTTVPA